MFFTPNLYYLALGCAKINFFGFNMIGQMEIPLNFAENILSTFGLLV